MSVRSKPHSTLVFQAKVTGRHAITLPAALCRELGIVVGDTIELEVVGQQAMLRKSDDEEPESIRGILKDYFPDWVSVDRFLREERAGWDEEMEQQADTEFTGAQQSLD